MVQNTRRRRLNVFFPDNIGYLIDSFLKYPDLTLKGFDWQPLEVLPRSRRKRTQKRPPSRRVWSRARDHNRPAAMCTAVCRRRFVRDGWCDFRQSMMA